MPLLLPNLDDRTWADLVAEGTSLIPVYGPEWTDQNYSDPGITLVELLAAIAEMDIYQLNQISDRERLRFLSLVGVSPKPPVPAWAVLTLTLADNISPSSLPVKLPEGLEFAGKDASGVCTRYRTKGAVTLAQGSVVALQSRDASGYRDLTPVWRRHGVISPFGIAPRTGNEFYLGLSQALPVNQTVQIFFTFADSHSSFEERRRLLCQAEEIERHCHPNADNPCSKKPPKAPVAKKDAIPVIAPKHRGVRTAWEFLAKVAGQIQWLPLESWNNEVVDDTRAFTLNGSVTLRVPRLMESSTVGAVAAPLYYLRCRFEAGSYDAAPSLLDATLNGIVVRQSVPSQSSLSIAPDASITYGPGGQPKPNDLTTLRLALDSQGRISQLVFGGGLAGDPQFRVLSFRPSVAHSGGTLCFEGSFLAYGDGLPWQQATLPDAPVEASSVQVYTLENDAWYSWNLHPDFDASTRKDFHAVLDPTSGELTFGDGENGRVPPPGCLILSVDRTTRAQAGNLGPGLINELADSPHNHALLYNYPTGVIDGWKQLKDELVSITNASPAWGGAAAETIAHASGKADQLVESSGRAVTLADYEQLAAATPGTRIARVTAIANMHPSFPCLQAPGMITVIVLPYLPQGKPMPSPGLLAAVNAYLRPRRIIGTRIEAVAPAYLDVAAQASVKSARGANRISLQQEIIAALNNFLDPLTGGPDGTGWPFGRDVYRSELMKVIDEVPGVDYVVSMALLANGEQPQCGNVCLGPTWLVAAGLHQITVL